MSSPLLESDQYPPHHENHDSQRIQILERLIEKLKRESLSLIRQSEAMCELFGGRIEELKGQIQELFEQEDFFNERLKYWRQRYTDLESKHDSLQYKYMKEHMYHLIMFNHLRSSLQSKNEYIDGLERGDGSTAPKQKPEELNLFVDPTPDWLLRNDPRDWFDIALRASLPSEPPESSVGFLSDSTTSADDASEHASAEPQSPEDSQLGQLGKFGASSVLSNRQDDGDQSNDKLDSAHSESDIIHGHRQAQEDVEDVEELKAEVERLRMRIQILENNDRDNKQGW